MITPGDVGSGSTANLCNINPADLSSQINNLVKRVEELEEAMSQILGGNVSADQLSEIAENVGWVYNVTYMGVPGWIQTSAGTLIPPAGVTFSSLGLLMSDGNPFPMTSVDSDGVLQFGFTPIGGIEGELPTYWNAGGSASGGGIGAYIDVGWHNNSFFNTPASNVTVHSTSRGAGTGTIDITGLASGNYLVHAHATQYLDFASGTVGAVINGYLTLGIGASLRAYSDTSAPIDSIGNARETASISTIFNITSTSQHIIAGWQGGVIGGSCTFLNPYEFSIQAIKIS